MTRRMIAVALLSVLSLSACASRSEVESLEAKVASLKKQAALQTVVNTGLASKLSDARGTIHGLRACLVEVRCLVDEMADATAFLVSSDEVLFGGSVGRFYALDCRGQLSEGLSSASGNRSPGRTQRLIET